MNKKDDMMNPTFVNRDGIVVDMEYTEWLKELKARYRQSQAKAAVRVNAAMLDDHQENVVIRQQLVDEFRMPDTFGVIPWGHHIYIFTKSQSLDEASIREKLAGIGFNVKGG
ncbi:MAG: hypothetical protein II951_14020 [Bacteroidales bacterium]|nr:hypothetical protein [Bacteroidales bacterium]